MNCKVRDTCRVCSGSLASVLDLGTHALAGQFPAQGEPDPPAFPLELCQCHGCGLVQLRHTVSPDLMFQDYFYRSGVTETMRRHLKGLAEEAKGRFAREDGLEALDIGCNDGTFLGNFDGWFQTGVDPSAETRNDGRQLIIRDSFPVDRWYGQFDLITSIACFYDVGDPVAFASAVREHLAPEGVWCVEVADLGCMLANGDYAQICHEHLCYYDIQALADVCRRANLVITDYSYNPCNGGSLRAWVKREGTWASIPDRRELGLKRSAERVRRTSADIRRTLADFREGGKSIHLLGASTKSNTILQHAGLGEFIDAASDRDSRKHGRRAPGTGIPIVSEEESRAMKPDVYLTCLQHFRGELLERERDFLDAGGKVVFALPVCEVVTGKAVASCS